MHVSTCHSPNSKQHYPVNNQTLGLELGLYKLEFIFILTNFDQILLLLLQVQPFSKNTRTVNNFTTPGSQDTTSRRL